MNISLLDRFSCHEKYYQFLYNFCLLIFLIALIFELLLFRNVISVNCKGVISQNNNLIIDNLDYSSVDYILNSKRIEVDEKILKYKVLEVKKGISNYTLKLKLDNFYLDSRTLNLKIILKDESLYQFILRKMKGE